MDIFQKCNEKFVVVLKKLRKIWSIFEENLNCKNFSGTLKKIFNYRKRSSENNFTNPQENFVYNNFG